MYELFVIYQLHETWYWRCRTGITQKRSFCHKSNGGWGKKEARPVVAVSAWCFLQCCHYFLQCSDTVGWVIWPIKPVPDMTYSVFTGTVNHTQSNQCCHCCPGDKDISPVTVPLILKVLFCGGRKTRGISWYKISGNTAVKNKEEEC